LDATCDSLENVKFQEVTNLAVHATLPASAQNCEDFCQAQAETNCQGSVDQQACQATEKSACDNQCSSSTEIVADGTLSAQALSDLTNQLTADGSLAANVDLVFDSLQ